MRRIAAAICSFTLLLAQGSWAATASGPDYVGVFEAATSSTARVPLERQKAQGSYKVVGFGFGGMKGFYQISGEHSPVRFKSNQKLSFIVRVSTQDDDPQNIAQISSLDVKSGQRILPAVSVLYSSKNKMAAHAISFTAEKVGTSFFKLSPVEPLAPGEYLVSMTLPQDAANAGARDVFLFGVD